MNKERLDIISKEIDRIAGQINSVRVLNVQILGVGLTGATTILVYCIKESKFEILIIIPYLLIGILFYTLLFLAGVLSYSGYRKRLEEELNKELNEDLIKWEKIAKEFIRTPLIIIGIQSIYVLFFLSVIILLVYYWSSYSCHFKISLIISFVVWIVLLAIFSKSYYKSRKLDDLVYENYDKI